MRETGVVIRFSPFKAYGQILPDGVSRQLVFVHITDVKDKLFLRQGDKVEFETIVAERGPKAKNVILLSPNGSVVVARQVSTTEVPR